MGEPDDSISIHEAARDAIDEEELERVLEVAASGEYEEDAVEALRAVTADGIVADALAATAHARRRGRDLTGEDVGDAADERRACCSPPQSRHWEFQSRDREFAHIKVEE